MKKKLLSVVLVAACGSNPKHAAPPPPASQPTSSAVAVAPPKADPTAQLADAYLDERFAFSPGEGVHLGLHQYDGRVGDRSAEAIAAHVKKLHDLQEALASAPDSIDKQILVGAIRGDLFRIETQKVWSRSPFAYAFGIGLTDYLIRDYAPLEDRARAVISLAHGVHEWLGNAEKNLDGPIPKAWVQLGMMMAGGTIDFAKKDAKAAFASLTDAQLKGQVNDALDAYANDVAMYQKWLMGKLGSATDGGYALGPDGFVEMLKDVEGIELDLPTLKKMAEDDTARNLAALDAAAKQIDPKKPVRDVILAAAADVPDPDKVLDVSRKQTADARQFVLDKKIVSVPSDHIADVKEAPPFMRFNPAFLSSAGVFETKALPSFYLVALPDPAAPKDKQKAMLMPTASYLFTAVHEVWPGHFVQDLHLEANVHSKLRKVLCTGTNMEGWAHYTEEMMWDAGFGGGDPKAHVGQLLAALMRDARFLAALGLHTENMSVDDAAKIFEEKAFMPKPLAMQQAVRGTIDPMYLEYTLGKLEIQKLRNDWKKKTGKDDAAFHDAFLDAGCEALPIVRQLLMTP